MTGEDHDLIIKLHTKVDTLMTEVTRLRDQEHKPCESVIVLHQRVVDLEEHKKGVSNKLWALTVGIIAAVIAGAFNIIKGT